MASVRKRQRKDGTPYWSVLYTLTGKQASTSFNDPADADALRELINRVGAARALQVQGIERVDRDLTVAKWVAHYIDHLSGVEPRTVEGYRAILRNNITPSIGCTPLAQLSRDDCVRWLEDMRATGAAGKTISNKHRLLSAALKSALREGHIPINPAAGVRLPRTRRKEMRLLSRDEFAAILAEVPDYWRPMVRFLVASGTRLSEATALRPRHVDRVNNTVRITDAWKRRQGGYVLGPTKTAAGERTINLPPDVLAALTYDNEYLFVGHTGHPVNPGSFRAAVWWPAVKRAGIAEPRPRIHDLRHACASWMIQAGIPLPVVQKHLGHESITITVDTYGHLDRASGRAAAEAIGRLLTDSSVSDVNN